MCVYRYLVEKDLQNLQCKLYCMYVYMNRPSSSITLLAIFTAGQMNELPWMCFPPMLMESFISLTWLGIYNFLSSTTTGRAPPTFACNITAIWSSLDNFYPSIHTQKFDNINNLQMVPIKYSNKTVNTCTLLVTVLLECINATPLFTSCATPLYSYLLNLFRTWNSVRELWGLNAWSIQWL